MQTIRLSRYCRFERNKHLVIFFYNAVFISKIKGKNIYQEGKCWTAKCIVGCIYRISCVCHRTTGTNAYRNANIVRHIPKPHLIELHAISLLPNFFLLWPLSSSETISSAAVIMYKCCLENWLNYRIYFFSVCDSSECRYSQKTTWTFDLY